MNKLTSLVLLLLCSSVVCAQSSVAGRYDSERDDGHFVELKANGRFVYFDGETDTGTFIIRGNTLTLHYDVRKNGGRWDDAQLTIEGKTLTTPARTHFYLRSVATADRPPTTPSQAVKTMFKAIDEGNFERYQNSLCEKNRTGPKYIMDYVRQAFNDMHRGFKAAGGLKSMVAKNERITGDSAKLTLTLTFNNLQSADGDWQLKKERGEWRVLAP
jgi:hypothetical protein